MVQRELSLQPPKVTGLWDGKFRVSGSPSILPSVWKTLYKLTFPCPYKAGRKEPMQALAIVKDAREEGISIGPSRM